MKTYKIEHKSPGYYTLSIDGKFEGNYDTFIDAAEELEHIKEAEDAAEEVS